MLVDLPNGRSNPNTQAYGHRDLAAKEHFMSDQPEPGAEPIIRNPEERYAQRHVRVTRRIEPSGAMEMEKELPNGDVYNELHGDQLLMTERMAVARTNDVIWISEVIEQLIARDNLVRSASLTIRMPAPPTQKRAGLSELIAHLSPFCSCVNSLDEDEP